MVRDAAPPGGDRSAGSKYDDDVQRQEEGAVVVRDAAPPGGDRSAGSAFRAASSSSEGMESWAAAVTLLLAAGVVLAAGWHRQARRRGRATTCKRR